MALEALAEVVADFQHELATVAADTASAVQVEVQHLMESPDDRIPEIMIDFAQTGMDQTIRETGNADLAEALWGEILEIASLPMSAVMSVPPADRGLVWTAAAALLLASIQRQAWITHGDAIGSIRAGIEIAAEQQKATRNMTPEQIRSANFPVKTAIKARRVAGQNG